MICCENIIKMLQMQHLSILNGKGKEKLHGPLVSLNSEDFALMLIIQFCSKRNGPKNPFWLVNRYKSPPLFYLVLNSDPFRSILLTSIHSTKFCLINDFLPLCQQIVVIFLNPFFQLLFYSEVTFYYYYYFVKSMITFYSYMTCYVMG